MWMWSFVSVGVSNAPMAIPVQSRSNGSQNSGDPHTEQKPRRAVSEDLNQVILSAPRTRTAERGTSVQAKKCPEDLRQLRQWHASGPGSAPSTSNVTAPQRQEPWW